MEGTLRNKRERKEELMLEHWQKRKGKKKVLPTFCPVAR